LKCDIKIIIEVEGKRKSSVVDKTIGDLGWISVLWSY